MKKILSVVFVLATILNAFGNAALAQNGDLTWFESLDKLQKLDSYTMQQVISGDLSSKDMEGFSGSGNFTFTVKSAIVNHDQIKMDSKNTVEGKLHVVLQGKDRPFNDADASFRLSVIALADQGSYVRLENVDFNANGILKKDMQDYLDFKTEVYKALDPIKWQWIQIPNQYIKGQVDQNAPLDLGALDTTALKDELVKSGFKKAIRKAVEDEIAKAEAEGTMTTEDVTKTRALVDRFFNTEFFSLKTSSKPGKEDQTSFTLNKNRILDFAQKASEEMGNALVEADIADLQSMLEKFMLTGTLHQNTEFGIFDRLRVNLSIREMSGLDYLRIGYSSKIGNVNSVGEIKPPAKSIPLEDANLGFLPPSVDSTNSDLNLDIPPSDVAPLPTDGF